MGTITIERGKNKSVITITEDGDNSKVNIDFTPELSVKDLKTEDEIFVANMTGLFMKTLSGE